MDSFHITDDHNCGDDCASILHVNVGGNNNDTVNFVIDNTSTTDDENYCDAHYYTIYNHTSTDNDRDCDRDHSNVASIVISSRNSLSPLILKKKNSFYHILQWQQVLFYSCYDN